MAERRTPFDWGLLEPAGGAADAAADDAVLAAMIEVERVLLQAWGELDGVDTTMGAARLSELAADPSGLDRNSLLAGVRRDGIAVVALVEQLRGLAGESVHRGATSQDILDTALVLVSRRVFAEARARLVAAGRSLADLAERERTTGHVARTLTQPAESTTLGASVAVLLEAVSSALASLAGADFPVQLGGAIGTGEAFAQLSGRADAVTVLRSGVAERLGLADPGRAWHTDRSPVLTIAAAAGRVCAAGGRIGRELTLAARDGILTPAHGGSSSAMPHKNNPVDAIVLTANGLRAGGLLATVQTAALGYDARPAGEWHAEWQAWRGLLRLVAETTEVLAVAAGDLVVHRRHGESTPSTIEAAARVIDAALARFHQVAGSGATADAEPVSAARSDRSTNEAPR